MNLPINIKTPQEMADNANKNKEETGFHHEEPPRVSFWCIWKEKIKAFYFIFRFKGF